LACRYIDARSGEVVSEGKAHDGTKASRAIFVSESDLIFTTGFSKMSERQYGLWNPKDLSRSLKFDTVDTGSGVLFASYDPDTRMIWVAGKVGRSLCFFLRSRACTGTPLALPFLTTGGVFVGLTHCYRYPGSQGDGNIRYFEVTDEGGGSIYYLSDFKSSAPQRGIGWLPKLAVNVNKCEVARAFKLHPKGLVEVISFTVPRKSTLFQDDIFPATKQPVAVLSADEWMAGKNAQPKMLSMRDFFVEEKRSDGGGGLGAKKGGLNKKGGLGGGAANLAATNKPAAAKPAPVAAAAKPAPAAAKPVASSGSSGREGELEATITKKDAEIKELKKHLATLEIKLREYEAQ
jgi:hypothetical protein